MSKKRDFMYNVRVNNFGVVTDFIEVGKFYICMRMPKDCWTAFEMAKQKGIIAYRRKGYMWIQAYTEHVTKITHLYSVEPKFSVSTYFPKRNELYTSDKKQQTLNDLLNYLETQNPCI